MAAQTIRYIVSPHDILGGARDIARMMKPDKIILFGSYANGNPTEDSDVDLLIVMRHRGPGYRVATRIRLALAVQFPMDLLVRSEAELRKGQNQSDWFFVEVLERGIVLHDRTNPAVGAKGRSRLRRGVDSATVSKTQPV